jgi:hypothetical protein
MGNGEASSAALLKFDSSSLRISRSIKASRAEKWRLMPSPLVMSKPLSVISTVNFSVASTVKIPLISWLSTCFHNYGHKPWFTTEPQRAQRKVFVCREIPTNKNILPQNNLTRIIFVYRYLPIDEKINPSPCPLCLSGEYVSVFMKPCTKQCLREWQNTIFALFPFSCRYRFFGRAKPGYHAQIPHRDASWRTCSFARFRTFFPARFYGPYPTAALGHDRHMKIACGQTIGSWVCDPPWGQGFPIQPCPSALSYSEQI